MKRKTVLVTGAYGFLGRNVSRFFNEKEWTVCGVGRGRWNKNEEKKWGIDWWCESEVNIELLMNLEILPDIIVHCAGSGSVSKSFSNPKDDFEANVSSVLPVLEYLRLKSLKTKLIYLSSAAVYGKKENSPIKEDDSLNPISPYGYHKKIAEELCESYSKTFNLNTFIIRFFSIYGSGLKKQLLWDACEKLKNSDQNVTFFGTGYETRDWIHIKDALNLIDKVSNIEGRFAVINGASGESIEIKTVINKLKRFYGKKLEIVFNNKVRVGDPKYYQADITKAKQLGWQPTITFDDGLKEYVDYYKRNI